MLCYYKTEAIDKVRDVLPLHPGTTVEKCSSIKRRYLIQIKIPPVFTSDKKKAKKEARYLWLDCESEANRNKWYGFLSRSLLVSISVSNVLVFVFFSLFRYFPVFSRYFESPPTIFLVNPIH